MANKTLKFFKTSKSKPTKNSIKEFKELSRNKFVNLMKETRKMNRSFNINREKIRSCSASVDKSYKYMRPWEEKVSNRIKSMIKHTICERHRQLNNHEQVLRLKKSVYNEKLFLKSKKKKEF